MTHTITVGARSMFVTVTAWAFIVLSAVGTVLAGVQNASVASMLVGSAPGGNLPALAPLTSFLLGYLPWVVGTGVVMSLATLFSAIGLLMRIDIARRTFIGLLAVAIVANLTGLWLQQEVMLSAVDSTLRLTSLPAHAVEVFGGFVTAARVMAVVVTLGACGLLAWIIARLMSAVVRQEFV
ncbi:MAG: hypothetical protein JWP52_2768 [Rhizobacter sp.]|jgi:hypothetical protein|nr:hypothetical protein [Rhizobacter sp.]